MVNYYLKLKQSHKYSNFSALSERIPQKKNTHVSFAATENGRHLFYLLKYADTQPDLVSIGYGLIVYRF